MKKNLLPIILLAGILFSCTQPSSKETQAVAPVDSLVANWNYYWNNHDSSGIRNLFAEEVVLTDDHLIATNIDEISAKMISPNFRLINNLQSSVLQQWSTAERAGYTGTYSLDVKVNDSIVASAKGVFTLNWVKTGNGEWKISTAVIYSHPEK